jgi:hypothetical protein
MDSAAILGEELMSVNWIIYTPSWTNYVWTIPGIYFFKPGFFYWTIQDLDYYSSANLFLGVCLDGVTLIKGI